MDWNGPEEEKEEQVMHFKTTISSRSCKVVILCSNYYALTMRTTIDGCRAHVTESDNPNIRHQTTIVGPSPAQRGTARSAHGCWCPPCSTAPRTPHAWGKSVIPNCVHRIRNCFVKPIQKWTINNINVCLLPYIKCVFHKSPYSLS